MANPISCFYQKGEVVLLIREDIKTKKYDCNLPNVCAVNIKLEEKNMIVGIYASESKMWQWTELAPFISSKCSLLSDFNADFDKDTNKVNLERTFM
jgi:hypothetical protein